MAYRHILHALERLLSAQSEQAPAPTLAGPVKRSAPTAALHQRPARRQPELRPPVAAILYKRGILTARNQSRGQRKRLEPNAVARRLIIEAEPFAVVPNFAESAGNLMKFDGVPNSWVPQIPLLGPGNRRSCFHIRRTERVGKERVENIRQQ